MKRIVFGLMMAIMLLAGLSGAAFAADILVEVNGAAVLFPDAQPFMDANNRTLVPLSPIATALGLTIDWDAEEQTATFSTSYTEADQRDASGGSGYVVEESMQFIIGRDYAWRTRVRSTGVTGTVLIEMNTEAILRDGRTFAPVRYLAEAFGYEVTWNAARQAVEIYAPGQKPAPVIEVPAVAVAPTGTNLALADLNKTYKTYWFDYTVKQAVKLKEYHGYRAAEGKILYAFYIAQTSTFPEELPMYSVDYFLKHESFNGYEEPIWPLNELMMPVYYPLQPRENAAYWVIFEIDESIDSGLSLCYLEIAEGNLIRATYTTVIYP